jgi:hypothetical protein
VTEAATTATVTTAVVADEPTMQGKADLTICWWITVAFYMLFGVIFVPLTHVMPPPSANVDPTQITAFFHDHAGTIQIGFVLLLVVMGLGSISNGLIAYQMSRMSVSKVFAYGYIATLGVAAIPGCLFAAIMCLTAVFRADTDPQVLALLYDMAFLSFVGSLGCFTANYVIFAIAILMDRNDIFPKWLAYVTVWQIVTELEAAPVFVFRTGPFSWNGVIAFWLGTILFGIFLVCVILQLRTTISRQPVAPIGAR